MKYLKNFMTKLDKLMEFVACTMLCICTSSAVLGVAMRYIFSNPLKWVEEVSGLTAAWMVFLILPKLDSQNEQLSMAIFFNSRKKGFQTIIRCLQSLLTIGAAGFLMKYAFDQMLLNQKMKVVSQALSIPWWIIYIVIPFSFLMLILVHVIRIITFDFNLKDSPPSGSAVGPFSEAEVK